MIQLTDIHKIYRMGEMEVRALRGVSLKIEQGEFVAIMGPSGSGKSTLMHILGLLDVPDSGSYRLLEREVSKLTQDELAVLRGRTVGFIFQQFHLLSRASALENVALPLLYAPDGADPTLPKKLLEEVSLGDRLEHKPSELSGGQQQRVAIARALVNNPSILFADEPTGNLDSTSQEEIMGILSSLNDRGITVILVTHEADVAKHARRLIRMKDGLVQSDQVVKQKTVVPAKAGAAKEPLKGALAPGFRFKEIADHSNQALRALFANKVRTALSMLGILIGVAAVIAMMALGTGARQSIQNQLSSLGSNLLVLRPGSRQVGGVALQAGAVTRFTEEDAKEIAATISSIRKVAPSVSGRGQVVYGNKNWNTQVLGTVPNYAPMRALVPTVGRFFREEEVQKRAWVAVVGMTLVRELFGEINPIGEFIKINRVNFQVIGILPEKGATTFRDQDDVIIIPLTTAMRRLLGKDYVDNIDMEVESPSEMASTEQGVRELIIRRHHLPPSLRDTFDIRNMADIQATLSQTSRTMSWLLSSIAAISLVVGGIGIMNIMLVSVTERTREIGLRKAIGARSRDIMSQFLIEAVVVSLLGGLAGILLGCGVTFALSALAHWAASVSIGSILLATLFSAGVGVIFGLWPARKASLLNPIEALRYE